MAENFEAQITQKQSEFDALKSQGDEVYKQFIDDVTHFLQNWYAETTKSYIISESDQTIKIGEEGLKELKNKLISLIDESDKIASKYLIDTRFCWHLLTYEEIYSSSRDTTTSGLFRYDDRNDKEINKKLHTACEKIGEILKPYGYVPQSYGETNQKQYSSYRLDWSEPMKKSIKSYSELCEKAQSLAQKIVSIKQNQKESQAKQMWDSI